MGQQSTRCLGRRARLLTRILRPVLITAAKLRVSRVQVQNRKHILRPGAFIVASNHISMADPIFLWGALRRRATAIAMKELWSWPLVGLLVRAMGHIPIDRGNSESTRKALRLGTEVLRGGGVVLIYPEGRISRSPGLEPFKPGVYLLAEATGAPVVPAGIRGADRFQPLGTWRLRLRHPVELAFGEPLHAADFQCPDACRAFLDELAARIAALSGRTPPPPSAPPER